MKKHKIMEKRRERLYMKDALCEDEGATLRFSGEAQGAEMRGTSRGGAVRAARSAALATLLAVLAFPAEAKGLSLQVIQRGASGGVFDTSYVVEQSILDYFFEHGMIVSNNDVIVSEGDEAAESRALRLSLIEAKAGCMDLFVKLYLDFALEDSTNPKAVLLSNIRDARMEILSIDTAEPLLNGKYSPNVVPNKNDNRGGVESFAADIAADIHTRLSEKGGAR